MAERRNSQNVLVTDVTMANHCLFRAASTVPLGAKERPFQYQSLSFSSGNLARAALVTLQEDNTTKGESDFGRSQLGKTSVTRRSGKMIMTEEKGGRDSESTPAKVEE